MIALILYMMLLLFTDKAAAAAMCMQALKQWYETMIPALFPMMLMSSIMVDTGFAVKLGKLLNRTILRFLHISDSGCYCLLSGFFFGFPMGAKTTADMYSRKRLSQTEAEFLLCFINCIGPMYTLQLVHGLFPSQPTALLFAGIYGLPFAYGIFLRYTRYRTCYFQQTQSMRAGRLPDRSVQAQNTSVPHIRTVSTAHIDTVSAEKADADLSFLDALYVCIPKCGKSMLQLGGYMILFQLAFVLLEHLLRSINFLTPALYPLLELTGGLYLLPRSIPLPWLLFCINLGGACCMLQTYSFLKPAGLNMHCYVLHKALLAAVIAFISGLI